MPLVRAIRWLLALASLAIVVWAFAFVSVQAIHKHAERAARPIVLTVLHWGNPAEDDIVRTLAARYEAAHPRVHVVRINPGNGSTGMTTKLKTMMAAGQPPDVFYLPPDLLPELAQLGLIAPLDERFAKDPPDLDRRYYATPAQWRADFYPQLVDAFRYDKSLDAVGRGPLFALPKDCTTTLFYVNTDLFDRAGIDWRALQRTGWTWAQFESDMKRITALSNSSGFEHRNVYGTLFQLWPDTTRNLVWSFGGDFFGTRADGTYNFRDVTLDQPGALRALDMVARMRLTDRTAFNASGIAKDGGQEFLNGNIGCTGPIGRWMAPTFKSIRNFKWDVVPIPHEIGRDPVSLILYTGWTMSSRSAHPDEAFDLIRFLCGRDGQVMQARAGLAIPSLKSVANSPDFLSPPPSADPDEASIPPHDSQLFLDAITYGRRTQSPREPEWGRILQEGLDRAIVNGQVSPTEAAKAVRRDWLAELDSPLRRRQFSPMPWAGILTITGAALVLLVGFITLRARRERLGALDRAAERTGWLFISPWVAGFCILTLGPMIASLLLSFSRWSGLVGLSEAEFVGGANFAQLFFHDPTFYQSLKVTAYFVLLGVPISQIASLAVALLMNQRLRGISIFRTIYFVPSVVSGVAMAVLWLQLFNNDYGLINQLLRPIAHALGTRPPNWFGVDNFANPPVNDAARWAVPAFVLMGLWGVGSGMIIYLAGLKGIPASLYEAATIDGAGALRRFRSVTLPMLSPLIFYNLVMGLIGSFQVFTQAYVMTGAGPDNATLFYVLNLYRQAFEFHNMGYASAMAWVLFVIVLALTALVFRASKNLVYYEGLKT